MNKKELIANLFNIPVEYLDSDSLRYIINCIDNKDEYVCQFDHDKSSIMEAINITDDEITEELKTLNVIGENFKKNDEYRVSMMIEYIYNKPNTKLHLIFIYLGYLYLRNKNSDVDDKIDMIKKLLG